MTDYLFFVGIYVPQTIMLFFSAFVSYKAIRLYNKTKKAVALLISITFLLFAANQLLTIFTTKIKLKAFSSFDEIIKALTTKTKLSDFIETKDLIKKSFILKYGLAEFLGFLVFLTMLFVFYKKLKKINYPAIFPKIIFLLCSFFTLLSFVAGIVETKIGITKIGLLPMENLIQGITLFLFVIGIASLGFLAHKKSKDKVYFYLYKSFTIFTLGVLILSLLYLFVTHILAFPKTSIVEASAFLWVLLPLYLYGYYLSLKAIKMLEK